MENKFIALIIVIIIAICGVSAFLLTQDFNSNNNVNNGTNTGNNTKNDTVNNNTNNKTIPSGNTDHKGNTDKNKVTASFNGPKYSAEGKSVKVTCKITNNGNESITNVEIGSQLITHSFGTIGPGESKTFTTTLQIPTTAGLIEDFDLDPKDAIVSNPFSFSSYSVTYDLNGENFQFNSNELLIRLV